jgi:hypothetical protein
MTDPFAVLGLPANTELTDDDVRAARAEAFARVTEQAGSPRAGGPVPGRSHLPVHAFLASRIGRGRPGRLALRALAVAAACYLAVVAAGWQPASAAVMTGALTWLLRTGRADLGPRRPDSS